MRNHDGAKHNTFSFSSRFHSYLFVDLLMEKYQNRQIRSSQVARVDNENDASYGRSIFECFLFRMAALELSGHA